MPLITYPLSLPGPLPGALQPRERRAGSSLDGPPQHRARQRDFAGATSRHQFVYSPYEMDVWRNWWHDDLRRGRRWFSIALPGAGGMIARVARYIEAREELLGSGNYRVTATFERRGVSQAPEAANVLLLDEFTGPAAVLSAHAPDIAPAGFEWAAGTLSTDGAGQVIGDESSTVGSGFSLELVRPYTIEIVATRISVAVNEAELFEVRNGGLQTASVALRNPSSGSGHVNAVWAAGGNSHAVENIGTSEHTVALRFNVDDTATAVLDGVEVATFAWTPPAGPITSVRVHSSWESGVGAGHINRVAIRLD